MGEVPATPGSDADLIDRISELLASPGGYPAFKRALGELGYDLKVREKKWPITPPWDVASIQKRGMAPRTIIDVGAARGTEPLYEAFPDAFLVLVEPLAEFAEQIGEILAGRSGEWLQTAVGSHEGAKAMNLPSCLFNSTFRDIQNEPEQAVESREVPVTTLDVLAAQKHWEPPFGLKLDVEGFEHHVLQGAHDLLAETQFVIVEVLPTPRSKDDHNMVEIFALLYEHGLELCDILAAPRPRVQREIAYMDALFWRRPAALKRQLD
jgi:FkbM family methyltransferase